MISNVRYSTIIDTAEQLRRIRGPLCDGLGVLEMLQGRFGDNPELCLLLNRAAVGASATLMMLDQALNKLANV